MKDLHILFEQSDNAIAEAFLQLCKERVDYFLLFLSRGEEIPYLEGVHKYVFDYIPDLRTNFFQREYCRRYLSKNYSQDGFDYDQADDVYDLITEMLVYSHIWEDVGFLKMLLRLASLLIDKEYPWKNEDIEKHRKYHTLITKNIIEPLNSKKLKLGNLLQIAYCSQIRNSFAHSMYEIHYDSRKVTIWGDIPEEYKYDITFEDFQKRFLYTVRIWNQLFQQFDKFREIAAENEMQSSIVKLSNDDGYLYLHAEMKEKLGKHESSIRGFIARVNK